LKDFRDLEIGDCFIMENNLWIRNNDYDPFLDERINDEFMAVNLKNGEIRKSLCGTRVLPVDVTINWVAKK